MTVVYRGCFFPLSSTAVSRNITVDVEKFDTIRLAVLCSEAVTSFKYLGSVITDQGSKPEILSRIAQTTAVLTRLKPVGNDRSISLSSKLQLLRSLVTSIVL